MSRHLLFGLLLATIVTLADDMSNAQQAATKADAGAKTEAAQQRTRQVQPPAEKQPRQTEPVQTRPEAALGRPEHAPVQREETEKQPGAQKRTEEAQGRTERTQVQTDKVQRPTEAPSQTEEGAKLISVPGGKALGMSILGNQDAPKSLVIVPWKTSEPGRAPGISPMLDDSRQPIDKEVFMRALRYYEIRSEAKP